MPAGNAIDGAITTFCEAVKATGRGILEAGGSFKGGHIKKRLNQFFDNKCLVVRAKDGKPEQRPVIARVNRKLLAS